jgi:hypothetical protein
VWISAIAVAPGSSDTIWVGHENGVLFQTTNGSAEKPAWKMISSPQLPRNKTCTRIIVDPGNPKRVFATFKTPALAGC